MCVAQTMNHCIPSNKTTSSSPTMELDVANNRILPESFEPTDNEVILGRGKQIASHKGNKLYKETVLSHIKEYSAAQTKALKSSILSHIVNKIRAKSAFQAGFVKQDAGTGRWTIAEDSAARIATAQIFRDALHDNYKSSKQFKQQRRQDRKGKAKKQKELRKDEGFFHPEGYLPQPQQPYSPPVLGSICQQTSSGVQDQLVGQLNNVLDQLGGNTSLTSLIARPRNQLAEFAPSLAMAQDDASNQGDDVVSVLYDHFSTDMDPSANPFEPRPISEDAVIISTGNGFRLGESYPI